MPYGWEGKLLKVDLAAARIEIVESSPYFKFLGGRGLCARIAWEEIPPGIDAYDAANRLVLATGPLTGTLAPTAGGRFEVGTVGPQVYPKPRFTRSSCGGYWGAELKYAGFDAVVVYGQAEKPRYLWINDGKAELRDASKLWGLDTFTAQRLLKKWHGTNVETVCIGPAGENLVRISTIQSNTENAAGQGGFGAVMGSKKLKAITVSGTGAVEVADPERLIKVSSYVNNVQKGQYEATWIFRQKRGDTLWWRSPDIPEPMSRTCTMSCTPLYCCANHVIYKDVPGHIVPTLYTGALQCVTPGWVRFSPWTAGFEAAMFTAMYGVNTWELSVGMRRVLRRWIQICQEKGLLKDESLDLTQFEKGEFWGRLIQMIAYKRGIGEILSEGLIRAAKIIGDEEPITHVARGFASHWDGHLFGSPAYPYWLVSALQWATDSRDPLVHGYAQEIHRIKEPEGPMPMEKVIMMGRRVYGSELAVHPESGYQYKAEPTIWHQNRLAVDDSLCVCDQIFPTLYSTESLDGVGDASSEAQLFSAVTGIETSQEVLDHYGQRIFTLERAIMVREGRNRQNDEEVIPYFQKPDADGIPMDQSRFLKTLDHLYILRKWDLRTGWPTRASYKAVELDDVADELELLGRLPSGG